jgi:hypothetical protein
MTADRKADQVKMAADKEVGHRRNEDINKLNIL